MAFHNYIPFTLSVYIAVSDAIHVMHQLTGALLTYEFGQIWAEYVRHDITPQLWRKLEGKQSIQGDSCNRDVTSR